MNEAEGLAYAKALPFATMPVAIAQRALDGYGFDVELAPDGSATLLYRSPADITPVHICVDLARAFFSQRTGRWTPGLPESTLRARWRDLAIQTMWPGAISLARRRMHERAHQERGLSYTDPYGEAFGSACAAIYVAGAAEPPNGAFRTAEAKQRVRTFIGELIATRPPVPSAVVVNEIERLSPNRWPGALANHRYTVAHTTEGTDSLGWLLNPASQVSATLLIPRVGPDYWRLGADDDAMWHAGFVAGPTTPLYDGVNPNLEARGIEFEGHAIEPLTDWQVSTGAAIIRAWGKPLVGHFELATYGTYYRSDPGAINFVRLKAAVEDGTMLTAEDVKNIVREMFAPGSIEGGILVEQALRAPAASDGRGGYAAKLQRWIDANLVYKPKTAKDRTVMTARRAEDPFAALPSVAPTGQKGEWPADKGPEPVAPERGATVHRTTKGG